MRLDGIDLLRGIAVSSVVLYHFFVVLPLMQHPLFPYAHTFGTIGVPLFFVISGFLIYRSIERNIQRYGRKYGITNFMVHRFFRIVPAYYFNLLSSC